MCLKDLTIIIPCYNEAQNLKELLNNLNLFISNTDANVIIVNDGSKDETLEILKTISNPKIYWLSHSKNRGYGNAIKSGIRECTTPFCVTIDGDGQHNLEDLHQLFTKLNKENLDLIIGNRNGRGSSMFRNFGKWVIKQITKLFLKIEIDDLNSGMKLYRTPVVKSLINWAPNGMSFSETITLLHYHFRYNVSEHPISINNREFGESTINYKTAIRSLNEILFLIINFYPFRFFGFFGGVTFGSGLIWSFPFLLENKGLTTGAAFLLSFGLLIIIQGVILQTITRFKFESYEHKNFIQKQGDYIP